MTPARHSHPFARPARQAGFTLLEVLVALLVAGVVLATLSQGLDLGWRASRTIAADDGQAAELEATSRLFRLLIARAAPGDPLSPEPVFVGAPHTVRFITRLPDGTTADPTPDSEVTLAVGGAHRLELHWRPHVRRWIAEPPPPAASVLLDRVALLDLSYWVSVPGDSSAGRWVTDWEAVTLPRLVRLRVVFMPGDRRHWPDIIVGPMRPALQP